MFEMFSNIDKSIEVIHKENSGLPSVRNVGLGIANRKWSNLI